MTTFHLHGGRIKPQIVDKTITKLFIQENVSNIIAFIDHHSQGKKHYQDLLSKHLNLPFTIFEPKLDLSVFDGVFISGGAEPPLLNTLTSLKSTQLKHLFHSTKVYVGCSSGVMLLGKYYYGWGSKYDNPYRLGLKSDGLGIYPDSLFEVHYSEVGFQSRLHQTYQFEPNLKHLVGIDTGSIVTIEGQDIANAKVTLGTAEIIHR